MNYDRIRIHLMRLLALLFLLASVASAGDQPGVSATLQPPDDRKPAPQLAIKDASGKMAELKDYHGRVVVLDFWATWCHGCKEEIPWFVELQKTYRRRGLAVVGVSMDQDGWKVVKPFVAETHVPYRILLADAAAAQRYEIQGLPDTFLIDRKGRVAAAYRAALVNRDDIEAKIKTLLAER